MVFRLNWHEFCLLRGLRQKLQGPGQYPCSYEPLLLRSWNSDSSIMHGCIRLCWHTFFQNFEGGRTSHVNACMHGIACWMHRNKTDALEYAQTWSRPCVQFDSAPSEVTCRNKTKKFDEVGLSCGPGKLISDATDPGPCRCIYSRIPKQIDPDRDFCFFWQEHETTTSNGFENHQE
jgi:hypothetical protein